jgi:hypothetical protein
MGFIKKQEEKPKVIAKNEQEDVQEVETTQEEEELGTLVVPELPQVVVREGNGTDGKKYHLVTITEAIQEILEIVRELKN